MEEPRQPIQPPRRLRAAYAYFVQANYHKVARELGTRRPQPVISRLGEMWRALPQEQRQEYYVSEERDRARYQQAKLEWVRQHAGRRKGYTNKRRRDPDAPRRPATPCIIYKRTMREKLRAEKPDATAKEREEEIIRMWRALPVDERAVYKQKAEEDKLRFAKEVTKRQQQERDRQAEEQRRQAAAEAADAAPPDPAPGVEQVPAMAPAADPQPAADDDPAPPDNNGPDPAAQ